MPGDAIGHPQTQRHFMPSPALCNLLRTVDRLSGPRPGSEPDDNSAHMFQTLNDRCHPAGHTDHFVFFVLGRIPSVTIACASTSAAASWPAGLQWVSSL
jgi:hypothetical protein